MTEAPSPFLPGTKVQFAWDSTSLGYIKACPRLYQYTMLEGWVPKDDSIHLRFGIEFHTAVQDYENLRADGEGFDNALAEVVRRLLVRVKDWDPDPTTKAGNYKNPRTLLQLVVDYFDQFRSDPCETFILDNGRPAVELSFRFELDFGPQAAQTHGSHELDEDAAKLVAMGVDPGLTMVAQPYILCGHLDRVVSFNSDLFVLDHKTTTTYPSDYYFNGFSPNNQMTLYSIAGKITLGTAISGVIVEASQICLETPNKIVRRPTYRTTEIEEEWLRDLEYHLNAAEAYAAADHWPMNDTACGMYGGCKFREVCSRSSSVREHYLKADFIQLPPEERWNPLRSR